MLTENTLQKSKIFPKRYFVVGVFDGASEISQFLILNYQSNETVGSSQDKVRFCMNQRILGIIP